ncbi:PepSY domain-containing protein [Methylotenera sp.]|uniref:PepSY domain-containing protein n=1 Tax=Methylotenera sp. TaxID=2051956 RepID=UPI002ED962CB
MKLRYLHLMHRWLGIGLGLLVLLWFLSGLVMLFVAYPQLTSTERLTHLDDLALQQVKLDAAQVWALTGKLGQPERVRLSMREHRPAYYFLQQGQWFTIWADACNVAPDESISGASIPISSTAAVNAARQFQGHAKVTETLLLSHDQWSISSSLNGHRPLYRVALNDAEATELYVSSHTGEVVLDTQGTERAWNWLGSVIHWIYFTPLRMEHELWRQIVLWLAFAGVVLTSLGLWLGVQRIRINRRYSHDRITPYHGWARWHHIVGLSAGVFCITWLFSGWLSLTPFGWFSDRSLSAEESARWAGAELAVQDMKLPLPSAADNSTATGIKEFEWLKFAGNTYVLARSEQQESLIDSQSGLPVAPFSAAVMQAQASKLGAYGAVASAHWLSNGDLYFKQDAQTTPQVLRIAFADALNTTYYVDARTTKILASQDSNSRIYRWLFNGLHRMDIPPLTDRLLARRITIFILSTGGVLLTVAGIVLGWRRVRRKWA